MSALDVGDTGAPAALYSAAQTALIFYGKKNNNNPKLIDELIKRIIKDPPNLAAVYVVGEIGNKSDRIADALLRGLKHEDYYIRNYFIRAIYNLGVVRHDILERLEILSTRDHTKTVRDSATDALKKLKNLDAKLGTNPQIALAAEFKKQNDELQKFQAEITELKVQLQQYKTNEAAQNQKAQELEAKITTLQQQNDDQKKSLDTKDAQINERDARLTQLTSQLADAARNEEQKSQELKATIETLQQQNEEYKRSLVSENDSKSTRAEIERREAKIEHLQEILNLHKANANSNAQRSDHLLQFITQSRRPSTTPQVIVINPPKQGDEKTESKSNNPVVVSPTITVNPTIQVTASPSATAGSSEGKKETSQKSEDKAENEECCKVDCSFGPISCATTFLTSCLGSCYNFFKKCDTDKKRAAQPAATNATPSAPTDRGPSV